MLRFFYNLLVDGSILGQQLVDGNKLCVGPLQRLDLLLEGCHLGHQFGNGIFGLLAMALRRLALPGLFRLSVWGRGLLDVLWEKVDEI